MMKTLAQAREHDLTTKLEPTGYDPLYTPAGPSAQHWRPYEKPSERSLPEESYSLDEMYALAMRHLPGC